MAEDQRAVKRRRFTSPIVNLKVGFSGEVVSVQEAYIRDFSPYLTKLLDENRHKNKNREIVLPTDSLDHVAAYVDYLYRGYLYLDKTTTGETDFVFLANIYSFAERVQDDICCDTVMTAFVLGVDERNKEGKSSLPGINAINVIYSSTTEESLLRRCVVDLYAQKATCDGLWKFDGLHTEFVGDLFREVLRVRPPPEPHGLVMPQCVRWLKRMR